MKSRQGFVLLWRSLLESPLVTQLPAEWFRLFVCLLMSVNWKPGRIWNGSANVDVEPGSIITSRENLSKIANISVQQTRSALKYLSATNVITIETTNQYTLIRLVNWQTYQPLGSEDNQQDNQVDNQQITNEQPADNQRITTIEESNKGTRVIREEENLSSPAAPDEGGQANLVLDAEFCEPKALERKSNFADLQEKWFAEEFWPPFWRKVDRKTALETFRKHARSEDLKNIIVTRVKEHSPYYHLRDAEKRPHASTWLNKLRYNEPFDASAPRFEIHEPTKSERNLSEAVRLVKARQGVM